MSNQSIVEISMGKRKYKSLDYVITDKRKESYAIYKLTAEKLR